MTQLEEKLLHLKEQFNRCQATKASLLRPGLSRAEIDRCDTHVREVASVQVEGVADTNLRLLLKCTETLQEYSKENTSFSKGLFRPRAIKDAFHQLKNSKAGL